MKKGSTTFLQIVIVLIGIGTFALLLWEPHVEGRNAHATLFEMYFKDPFLALVYVGSIPFFVALWKAFTLLRYVGENKVFTQPAVNALRAIKYCALLTAGAIVAVDSYIFIMARYSNDDPAGALMLGFVATFCSIIVAALASVFEKVLQSAAGAK